MLKAIWFLAGFVVAYFVVVTEASINAKVLALVVYFVGIVLVLTGMAPILGVVLQGGVGIAIAFWLAYRREWK